MKEDGRNIYQIVYQQPMVKEIGVRSCIVRNMSFETNLRKTKKESGFLDFF
jgi:hypothetical protein